MTTFLKLLLLTTLCCLCLCPTSSQAQSITITGKLHNGLDTLILLKPFEDFRYNGVRIPTNPDSTFSYTFVADGVEQYQLIHSSEVRDGSWRDVPFFTDAAKIHFDLFGKTDFASNRITGSESTNLLNDIEPALMQHWMPAIQEIESQRASLPTDVMEKRQNDLIAKAAHWELDYTKDYPVAVRISRFYTMVDRYKDQPVMFPLLKKQHLYRQQQDVDSELLQVATIKYEAIRANKTSQRFVDFFLITNPTDSTRLADLIAEHKYTVLDLWSPWCGPCIRKSRELKEHYEWLSARGIAVIGVLGGVDSAEKYQKAKERHPYPWPVYPEISDHQSIWLRYGLEYSGGQQVVIDQSGKIVARNPSFRELRALVK